MDNPDRLEAYGIGLSAAVRLGEASRRMGGLETIARTWPLWSQFSIGPFRALQGFTEARHLGMDLDLGELLALGPEPDPSRPSKGLRQAVGVMHAMARLDALPAGVPITPGLVSEIFHGIDAPHLARGGGLGRSGLNGMERTLPGAAVWTLAPKWVESGLPLLWALALALATWEREGPEHPHQGICGRVLLAGLARRLGAPSHAFCFLGPYLELAASSQPGGYAGLVKNLRKDGSWRLFAEVFLAAVRMSAAQAVELVIQIQQIRGDHRDLIKTWVRAPQNPQRLLELLIIRPVVDLPQVAQQLEVTQRTAGLLVNKLEELSLLIEITGQKRGRKYAYKPVMAILQPGWGEQAEEPDNTLHQAPEPT